MVLANCYDKSYQLYGMRHDISFILGVYQMGHNFTQSPCKPLQCTLWIQLKAKWGQSTLLLLEVPSKNINVSNYVIYLCPNDTGPQTQHNNLFTIRNLSYIQVINNGQGKLPVLKDAGYFLVSLVGYVDRCQVLSLKYNG